MAPREYEIFDLLVERRDARFYARVLSSPAGNVSADLSEAIPEAYLSEFLSKVGHPRGISRSSNRSVVAETESFGDKLFAFLLPSPIASCLERSRTVANDKGRGLRIQIRLSDVPELCDLPWEFLHDNEFGFFSLTTETSIVRYLELKQPLAPLNINPPLRILVMISSPSNSPPLDVEHEWNNLVEAVAPLKARGLVDIQRLDNPQLTKLDQVLRATSCHILHFIGHGFFDEQAKAGHLYFQDSVGRAQPVSGEQIGTALRDHKSIRLVMLNACEGARSSLADPFAGIAQALIRRGVPAVIAMQFEVSDTAAITFASEFYAGIAVGDPIDACVASARRAIYLNMNDIEWATPVLYLRSTDSQVFLVEQTVIVVDQRALHLAKTLERDQSAERSQQIELQGRSLFMILFASHERISFTNAWTLIALYLQNFLLNWRVNISVLCLALVLLKFLALVSVGLARSQPDEWVLVSIGLFGAFCLVIAQALIKVYGSPQPEPSPTSPPQKAEPEPSFNKIDARSFLKNDLVWSILSAIALTILFCSQLGTVWIDDSGGEVMVLILAIVGAFLFAAGWIAGWPVRRSLRDFALWIVYGLVYGALVGFGAYSFALMQPYLAPTDFKLSLPIVLGIPWILTAQFAAKVIFGGYENDSNRSAVVAIALAVIAFLSVGISNFVYLMSFHYDIWSYITTLGVASGIAAALLGKSGVTSAISRDRRLTWFMLDLAPTFAGAVFVGCLIVVASTLLDLLMFGATLLHALHQPPPPTLETMVFRSAVAGTVAAVMVVIARKTRSRLT
jgi:hypothetical protein